MQNNQKTRTTILVTHLEEYKELHGCSLFGLLHRPTVSSYMVTWSIQTHHNQHKVHEQPTHHRNDLLVNMKDRVDDKVTAWQIQLGSWSIMIIYKWYECLFHFQRTIDCCTRRVPSNTTVFGLLFGPWHSLHAKYIFRKNKKTEIIVFCLL